MYLILTYNVLLRLFSLAFFLVNMDIIGFALLLFGFGGKREEYFRKDKK